VSAAAPSAPPEVAWWVALAGLPGMGPARLRALQGEGPGAEVWATVAGGRVDRWPAVGEAIGRRAEEVTAAWASAARRVDVDATWAAHAHLTVSLLGSGAHPRDLDDDHDAPVVLFAAGEPEAVSAPTVAVVGTRRCTRAGAELAYDIGRTCAAAGVAVVSGLATGIDTAAHRGCLDAGSDAAPPVGVVGSGLDVVYPTRSRDLWAEVPRRGVLLSEYPLGTSPARWRFPARNRLVAALADVVVVVESGSRGGSLYTVDEAIDRDRTVMAVPGPVRSPASHGTNQLLVDGIQPLCAPEDVLVALGLAAPRPSERGPGDPRPRPSADGRRVLEALGWEPATIDVLAARTGLGLGRLAVALDELDAAAWIHRDGGQIERKARP